MYWAASGAQGKSLSPLPGTGEAAPGIGVSSYGPSLPVQEEIVETGKEGPWKHLNAAAVCGQSAQRVSGFGWI